MIEQALTRRQQRQLESELLAKFVEAGGTATITALFDGFRPVWALDAADRLEERGCVRLLDDGRTQVTPAGLAEDQARAAYPAA